MGTRTLVMGILNVTPDSFSDGGRHLAPESALAAAKALVAEGADILDIGGESTRPGHIIVEPEAEWARIAPVFAAWRAAPPGVPISIDTWKAEVARSALRHGAAIVNDVWGFQRDPAIAAVTAEAGAAAILMHNRTAIDETIDIVDDIIAFLERSLTIARRAGIPDAQIVLDPGIGFGKSPRQSFEALAALPRLKALGFPVLLGASRKRFIASLFSAPPEADQRLPGTLAAHLFGVMAGVEMVRVHDVAAHVQAIRVLEATLGAKGS